MKRAIFLAGCLAYISLAPLSALAAHGHAASGGKHGSAPGKQTGVIKYTAAQIVAKNVEARGGLKAWRAVNTVTFSGKMDAGGKKNVELPFVMKMKRPHMNRLELRFQDQTAIQVYNGETGWKVRPFMGRGDEPEPFTPAETKTAATWDELDGPLVDYARKGTQVTLDGMETVEGHQAYKLKLTMKDGSERHVWIDATTFLERKIDGEPRILDGKLHNVTIYYRDYKTENGLKVPHVLETVVEGVKPSHKMYIEHVAVNKPMDDTLFANPNLTKTSY